MDAAIKKELDRINKKLSVLLEARKQQECWVKASVIQEATGWNAEGMRQARENGYVKFKEDKPRVFTYDLNSINSFFIKKATA